MRLAASIVAFAAILAGCGSGGAPTAPEDRVAEALRTTPELSIAAHATPQPLQYTLGLTCSVAGCGSATVTLAGAQVGTASYTDGIQYFIPGNFAGSVTFLGRTFPDLTGTFSGGANNIWTLNGTFSKGRDTFNETFYVYGHSGRGGGTTIINESGLITTPLHTPSPTPQPTQRPSPTPRPTPTDS